MFYKMLLVLATLFWGFSFVVVKDAVDAITPAWLMFLRFGATALVLAVAFRKTLLRNLNLSHLFAGAILGVFSFLGFWVQTVGITDTTPGKNAFLTATYCVMVPFLYWLVARKKPTVFNLIAAVLCILGVAFVSMGNDFSLDMRWGDWLTLLSAVFFAIHMVLVPRFSARCDIMTITIVQIATSSLLGGVIGLATSPVPSFAQLGIDFWTQLAYLVLFASCCAMVFQNIAQTKVPPTQASLLMSLESVFGVVFSVLLYGEQITTTLLLGFALIFASIIISEVFPLPKKSGLPRKM